MPKDPVCGMESNERQTMATGEHQGRSYHSCAPDCKREFEGSPRALRAPDGVSRCAG